MNVPLHTLCLLLAVVIVVERAPADEGAAPPFRFTDATAESGLADPFYGAFHHAMVWGDFDGDGRQDLFLGNFADRGSFVQFGLKHCKANMLLRQTANGRFEPFSSPPVELPGRCSGGALVDLDNDGDLDLFVTSNTKLKPAEAEPKHTAQAEGCRLYRNDGGGKFVDVSADSGACPAGMLRCRDVGVLDYDGDGLLDLLVVQDCGAEPGDEVVGVRMFHNLGKLHFEDSTAKVGLPKDLWGAGIAIADLNGDHRPDFYVCGGNRLYLSQPDQTYKEASSQRPVFSHPEKELDWVVGATFGDLDNDGDFDLITGRHSYFGPSRAHVYLNEGTIDSVPKFREITADLGIPALPQKAPHVEIQDFDNDGIPDLYWSVFFTEGTRRQPFICKGLGVKEGLPRFAVPSISGIEPAYDTSGKIINEPPAKGRGMVYYVNGPAVDFDGDGDLDLCCGNWPPESSHLYRNDTPGGHWIQVRAEGRTINRMGVGARVSVYAAGHAGEKSALLGCREITLNGGYSSSRPAIVHFGLGTVDTCDITVQFGYEHEPQVLRQAKADRLLLIKQQ